MPEPELLGHSKTKILNLLRTEGKTASQIASGLRIQISAARKHLEELASLDIVTASSQKGTVGRPKKFYTLAEKGREMFPRSYDILLTKVVAKLVEREGVDHAESLMRSIAVDVAQSLDGREQHDKALNHLKSGINELGFEATVNKNDGELTILSKNCPVWKAAMTQGEVICRGYHAELLKIAFKGKSVDRKEWMVDGDSYCKHVVSDLHRQ